MSEIILTNSFKFHGAKRGDKRPPPWFKAQNDFMLPSLERKTKTHECQRPGPYYTIKKK